MSLSALQVNGPLALADVARSRATQTTEGVTFRCFPKGEGPDQQLPFVYNVISRVLIAPPDATIEQIREALHYFVTCTITRLTDANARDKRNYESLAGGDKGSIVKTLRVLRENESEHADEIAALQMALDIYELIPQLREYIGTNNDIIFTTKRNVIRALRGDS